MCVCVCVCVCMYIEIYIHIYIYVYIVGGGVRVFHHIRSGSLSQYNIPFCASARGCTRQLSLLP